MLLCVQQAEHMKGGKGKKKKLDVWERAADLYRQKFIESCHLEADQTELIRGPTTAEFIREAFEDRAQRLREEAAAAPPAGGEEAAPAPEEAAAEEAAVAEEATAAEKAAPEVKREVKRATKRDRVVQGIVAGRQLFACDVPTTGVIYLTEYVRAMGVVLGRGEEKDAEALRARAASELAARGGSWCVNDDEAGRAYVAKRQKVAESAE